MGANYTRQSTYADGDTINAADTNDEFDQLLAAFAASTGHTHDGTTGEGGPISALVSNAITFGTGADTDIAVTFDANSNDGVITWKEDEDYFEFSDDVLLATTEKVQFRDTAIHISSSTDGQLDLVADTEIQLAATTIDMNGNVDISGTIVGASTISAGTAFVPDASDGAALGTSSLEFSDLFLADAAVINLGADQDTTLTHVADTGILLNSTRQLQFGDSGTYIHQSADGVLDLASDTEIEINATTIDMNGAAELSGNLTLGAQLRMPDNTASKLLIADGTSYEEKAVGDLSEIATVANDDVFLAVDTSGGGLKKITRSTIVSGLASSAAISNVVEDTTPQLGGDLDTNGNDIVTTSNADIDLAPNGTGKVVVKGNTNPGTVVFNCEANTHGQTVKAQPHSASVTNVLTLPPGGDQEIVGTTATQTLTNKTIDASQLSGTVANARLDAQLQDVAGLAVTDGNFIVGDGSNFVAESGATARTSLGLGTSATTDTGISSGNVAAFTSGVADDDFLRIDGTAVEGRSAAEVLSDISAMPLAGGAFTGDVTFTGDNYNIVFDKSDDRLEFADNAKASFGTGNDISIHWDGTDGHLSVAGTLNVEGSGETLAKFIDDGAVELYHNNSKKIETTANGVTVTGTALATTNTDTSNTGSVTLDFEANQNHVLTLTGNVTLANPSTEQVGQSGFIVLIQDSTGGRTVSLGTDYETAGGAGLTLSSAASATDIVPYVVAASSRILLGTPQLAFS